MLRYVTPLTLACCLPLPFTSALTAAELTPLVDLNATVQQLSEDNLRLQVSLKGAIDWEGKARDLSLTGDWISGAAGSGHGSAGSWNKGKT